MNDSKIIKEACAYTYNEAKFYFELGADRVELCENAQASGTTPSYGCIKQTLKLSERVVVMIRPRGGDFIYNHDEIEIMKSDIECCKQLGVKEVILGVLTKEGLINEGLLKELVECSRPMGCVFHMAFDEVVDQERGLDILIRCGVKRVLSKGSKQSPISQEGREQLKYLNSLGKNIQFIIGGGVNGDNYHQLSQYIGVNQVHGTKIMIISQQQQQQ